MENLFHKKGAGYWLVFFTLLLFSQRMAAQPAPEYNRAMIKPSVVHLNPGEQKRFKAIMLPQRREHAYLPDCVKWYVNGIPGGNTEFGTIDPGGVYTAPGKVPSPVEINISAEVMEASNSFLWATVLLGVPGYELIDSWVESRDNAEYFINPHGITIGIDGNLIIADEGSDRVLRFNTKGEYIGDVGSGKGQGPGYFNFPRIAEQDSSGNIFVVAQNHREPRVQVFSPDGQFIHRFGGHGNWEGRIIRPHGIGFNTKQQVFIPDVDLCRINVYSNSGDFLYSWERGGLDAGEFDSPHGLAIDANDDVFVSNFFSPVQKLCRAGRFLFAFGYSEPCEDHRPVIHAINADHYGNIYVVFVGGHSIHKYNNNGDFITSWTLSQPDYTPIWAAVDKLGKVYVVFSGNDEAGVEIYIPK